MALQTVAYQCCVGSRERPTPSCFFFRERFTPTVDCHSRRCCGKFINHAVAHLKCLPCHHVCVRSAEPERSPTLYHSMFTSERQLSSSMLVTGQPRCSAVHHLFSSAYTHCDKASYCISDRIRFRVASLSGCNVVTLHLLIVPHHVVQPRKRGNPLAWWPQVNDVVALSVPLLLSLDLCSMR